MSEIEIQMEISHIVVRFCISNSDISKSHSYSQILKQFFSLMHIAMPSLADLSEILIKFVWLQNPCPGYEPG